MMMLEWLMKLSHRNTRQNDQEMKRLLYISAAVSHHGFQPSLADRRHMDIL
jgi:hypothetical protein